MGEDKDLYVYGPKVDTPKNTLSLGEFFAPRLEAGGDKTAQIIEAYGKEETLTYAEILHKGKVAAGLFKKHGLKPRDTVMSVTGNTLEYAPIIWGTLFNAAAIAPVNPLYDLSDMIHLIKTIEPQIVVCNSYAEVCVQTALTQYAPPVVFITMPELEKYIAEHADVGDFVMGKVEEPDTHVASVICTTGTSGKPKCVEISHTTIMRQLDLTYFKTASLDAAQMVSVNIAGPFGVAGQLINLTSINLGMKSVLVPIETFEEVSFLNALVKYKVNFMVLGPCQLIALAKCSASGSYDLSSLKQVIVGGSPVSTAMCELASTQLKLRISVTYGMTESPGVCKPAYNSADKPATIGTLGTNCVAKIVDLETGKALGPRQEGEFCIITPSGMLGYRNNAEATKAAFDEEGFLHTGDVGFYDEEQYFYVVDRSKELIKYRNVHVPATDIEDVLVLHPSVAEVAVIGVYHETDWEHATAIVVVQPGEAVTAEELVKLVEAKLPPLKWLRGGVKFVDSIPKSLNGKFNKRALRAHYAAMPSGLPSPSIS